MPRLARGGACGVEGSSSRDGHCRPIRALIAPRAPSLRCLPCPSLSLWYSIHWLVLPPSHPPKKILRYMRGISKQPQHIAGHIAEEPAASCERLFGPCSCDSPGCLARLAIVPSKPYGCIVCAALHCTTPYALSCPQPVHFLGRSWGTPNAALSGAPASHCRRTCSIGRQRPAGGPEPQHTALSEEAALQHTLHLMQDTFNTIRGEKRTAPQPAACARSTSESCHWHRPCVACSGGDTCCARNRAGLPPARHLLLSTKRFRGRESTPHVSLGVCCHHCTPHDSHTAPLCITVSSLPSHPNAHLSHQAGPVLEQCLCGRYLTGQRPAAARLQRVAAGRLAGGSSALTCRWCRFVHWDDVA